MKRARNVALLLACALLGLVVAAPMGHSNPPCWAHHRTCPTTSTTAPATTSTQPATTTVPATTTTAPATTTASTTTTTTTPPATTCNLYAAPTGSDSASGSVTSPFATLVKLDQALAPGQTGCLRGGTYGSTSTEMDLAKNGSSSGRITLTAYPGETPLVKGWINITGAYTTLSYLRIDGSNTLTASTRCATNVSESLTIAGADTIFEHNDYFQSIASTRANGIGIGWWGMPDNTIVRFNKIHDVGGCQAYDHLIYLSHGNNVQIYGNWMWNDAHGWGVQLYPGPTNARVFGNVIDAAGAGFVFDDNGSATTTGNQAFHNIVVNEVGVPAPASIAGACIGGHAPVAGSNNSFDNNDCWNNPNGIGSQANVEMSGNTTANPLFVDAAAHDYRLQSSSPFSSWGTWNGQ